MVLLHVRLRRMSGVLPQGRMAPCSLGRLVLLCLLQLQRRPVLLLVR